MKIQDYYSTLGVEREALQRRQIKKAFREKLARQYRSRRLPKIRNQT